MKMHLSTFRLLALAAMLSSPSRFVAGQGDPGFIYSGDFGFGSAWDLAVLSGNAAWKQTGGLKFSPDGNSLCIVQGSYTDQGSIYCFDVTRNPVDGTVVDLSFTGGPINIREPDGITVSTLRDLDNGFSPGPGNFDYVGFYNDEYMGLVTWEYDANGKPTQINIEHTMECFSISLYGIYSMDFSNIVTDPSNPGNKMMFAVGYYEMLAVPLIPANGYYDIDYGNVQFLCELNATMDYPGDFRLIKSGVNTNDFLITDWNNQKIRIIDIDPNTGYPVGYDPTSPVLYDPTKYPTNALPCPFIDYMDTTGFYPWGMQFDEANGDFFFADWEYASGKLFRIRGFPPGFDPSILGANVQAAFEELIALINAAPAAVRRLASSAGTTGGEKGKSQVRGDNRRVKEEDHISRKRGAKKGQSTRDQRRLKGDDGKGKGKGDDGTVSTTDGKLPKSQKSSGPLETPVASTQVLLGSMTVNGVLVLSPELNSALSVISDPDQQSFIDSLSGGTTSAALQDKITQVVGVVEALTADSTDVTVLAKAAFLLCLLDKINNAGVPLNAEENCVDESST